MYTHTDRIPFAVFSTHICAHSYTSAFRARCTLLQLDCHSRRLNFARKLRVQELNFHAFVSYISRFLQAASYDIAIGAMMPVQIVNDPNSSNVQTELEAKSRA